MLLDLLSMGNYLTYNVSLANIIGLHPAIYLSELLNINNKAILKDKLVDDSFILDRNYITRRTTLSEAEQAKIDELLQTLNIISKEPDDPNKICIRMDNLLTIINASDATTIKNIQKMAKIKTKRASNSGQTQREKIAESLKKYLHKYNNEELDEAYEGWIDGVYSNPKGFLSKRAIELFQQQVDAYAQGNLDLALIIINIATINGYRDAQWAIEKCRNTKIGYRIHTNIAPQVNDSSQFTNVELSNEVF